MKHIVLTEDFNLALDLLENTRENIFISGKAGTGKSTLLKEATKRVGKRKYAVVAPTGIAAMNACGETIHSFFKINPTDFLPETEAKFRRNPTNKILKNLNLLIVDEVSMLRVDLFDFMDRLLQVHKNNSLPFGGVQVILFGDLFQIPPVVPSSDEKKIKPYFDGYFFFNSPAYKKMNFRIIDLKTIFRQNKDEGNFKEALNNIRVGDNLSHSLDFINTRRLPIKKNLTSAQKFLSFFYKFFQKKDLYEKWEKINEDEIMKIAPKNETVFSINKEHYEKINEKEFVFKAILSGEIVKRKEREGWEKMTDYQRFVKVDKTQPRGHFLDKPNFRNSKGKFSNRNKCAKSAK